MKYILFMLCYLMLSCASSKKSTNANLDGSWELSLFSTSDKTFAEIFGQRKPELQFDVSKGTVTGNTGCNHLSGSYSILNDQLSFGSGFITTKMACPGYEESVFLDAFNKVNRFEIVNDQLRLLHDSTWVMSFSKK